MSVTYVVVVTVSVVCVWNKRMATGTCFVFEVLLPLENAQSKSTDNLIVLLISCSMEIQLLYVCSGKSFDKDWLNASPMVNMLGFFG